MCLQHQNPVIEIGNQAGQAVPLTMHQPENICVRRIKQTETLPVSDSLSDPFPPECGVDHRTVKPQNLQYNIVLLVMPRGEILSVNAVDIRQTTILRFALNTLHRTGKNPGVATVNRFFLSMT